MNNAVKWGIVIVIIVVIVVVFTRYAKAKDSQTASDFAERNGMQSNQFTKPMIDTMKSNEIWDVKTYENWRKKITYTYVGTTEEKWRLEYALWLVDRSRKVNGRRIETLPAGYPYPSSVIKCGAALAAVIMELAWASTLPGERSIDNLNTTDMMRLVSGRANDLSNTAVQSRVTNQSQYAWSYAFHLISDYAKSNANAYRANKYLVDTNPTGEFVATTSWKGNWSMLANFVSLILENAGGKEPKGGSEALVYAINQLPKVS